MTPEKQRIAIAEACGWHISPPGPVANGWALKDGNGCVVSTWWLTDEEAKRCPPSLCTRQSELPDYLSDLNAMHEAEKVLDEDGEPSLAYGNELWAIVSRDSGRPSQAYEAVPRATAAQRAEAFLCTIGKWDDSK